MISNNDDQPFEPINNIDVNDQSVENIDKTKYDNLSSNGIEEISIYNIRTKLRRNLILLSVAVISFLVPFCDTIYLPALPDIEISLNASATLVTLSMSIYLLMSGIFSLVWGSLSDRFGRKKILIIGLIIFIIASIVCVFSMTITVLLVFRAIEGGSISATLVIGQSLVADIYPANNRGTASGFFFLPFNIGPMIGPLVGGPLSNAYGWRSTFVLLAIYGFVATVLIFILVPETHQYFAKKRFEKANPEKRVIDAAPNEKPSFEKPWKSLAYLIDLPLLPYMAIAAIASASLMSSFMLFSIYLSEAPYNYSETTIGLLYAPGGIAMFTGSVFGGWLSDKASQYFGHQQCPEGRLVPALLLTLLVPIGLLIYGWILDYQLSVVGPIIGQILISFGQAALEPSVSSYLTIMKQKDAAAVSAANTFFNLCAAAIFVTLAVPLVDIIGTGPYFSLIAGINLLSILVAGILVYKKIRRSGYIKM